MMVVWLGGLVLMALDGGRYRWSHVPLWMQVVGFILICVGFWLSMLTFKANSYAAPVVKIQKERGHRVVTTGPSYCGKLNWPATAIVFSRFNSNPITRRLSAFGGKVDISDRRADVR